MNFADAKSKVVSFFRNDWPLKLISILLSVVIWFFICEYVDPDTDIQVSGIKISVDASTPLENGVGIMTAVDETVDIRVSGSRDTVALMDHNKIKAYLDLANVTASGEYDVKVKIDLGNQGLSLVSQSIDTVKVRFDTNKLVNVKVNATVKGNVAEGFILEAPTMLNNFIPVTGPAAIVDTIVSAEIKVEQDSFPETSTLNCDYEFIDQNGDVVPKTFLMIEDEYKTIPVTISVVKEKTVPMTVSIVNSSGGKDSSFCVATVEPETIKITGSAEVLDAINTIDLGVIDVAEKTENFETSVKVVLPNGVKNVNNVESVKVTVVFNDVQTRSFSVSNIQLENMPDGMKAAVAERSVQVKVRGISEDVLKLNANDLKIVVDVRNQVLEKDTLMQAYVVFPDEYKVGAVGKYQLTVVVS